MKQAFQNKSRVILFSLSLLLALVGAIVLCLAIKLAMSPDSGYFDTPYPAILLSLLLGAVLFSLSTIPCDYRFGEDEMREPIPLRIVALIVSLSSAVFAIFLFTTLPPSGNILQIAAAICALITTLYFLLVAAGERAPSAARGLAGFGYILMHVLYVMVIYFQNKTAANAPIKIAILCAWLLSLLYALADVRLSLGREPHPLTHAFARLGATIGGAVGLGGILAAICGVKLPYGILPHLFLTFYALYIIIRMIFIPKIQKQAPTSGDIAEEMEVVEAPISLPQEKEIPTTEDDSDQTGGGFFSAPIIETHPSTEALNLTDPTPKNKKGE